MVHHKDCDDWTPDRHYDSAPMKRLLLALVATLALFGCGNPPSSEPRHTVSDMPAIQQASLAFDGGHSAQDIQAKLDEAFTLYGLEKTNDTYSRAGSVLVTMRKAHGVSEMQILDHMIRSHVPGLSVTFPEAAALSAVALRVGDR